MTKCLICGKPCSEQAEAHLEKIKKTGSIRETTEIKDLTPNELEAYIEFLENDIKLIKMKKRILTLSKTL